ncbi:MAG: DUF2268 domain-containing putative Zn-dependent protease [Gemmatimonadota bacterium]
MNGVGVQSRRLGTMRMSGVLLLLGACANSATGPDGCDGSTIDLGASSCLSLRESGLDASHQETLELEVRRTLEQVNQVMAIDDVLIRVIGDATRVIPEVGLGGFAAGANEVRMFVNPDLADQETVLSRELLPLLAHELHHAKRMRTVGYGSTLLEAAISEGLADHFSVEVAGIEPPPWSVAVSGTALQEWTATAVEASAAGPFDHSDWFFGTDPAIPRWTGYSIGFEFVRQFLEANTSAVASRLHDEPASSFLAGNDGQ